MPLTLPPPLPTREDVLTRRMQGVSARLRRVVVLRAGSWLIVLSLLFVGALGYADHRFHLPALVRALGLVALIAGVPLLFRRWISRPLAGSCDPVRVAMRVVSWYPGCNGARCRPSQCL